MGIMSLIEKLLELVAPPDAMKLDGTTEATLARCLSALPPDERGWITFAEARILFSTKGAQYAFGETDQNGRRNIESFAAQHRSVIHFMPVEDRVYFVRDPRWTARRNYFPRSRPDQASSLLYRAMRSARTWPMASSAMSSATPSRAR